MNFKKSLITLWIIIISFSAYSQARFSFGPEIGVNGSSFNYHSPGITLRNYVKNMDKPVFSPIGGIWAKFHFHGKFSMNFGVQYFQVGSKSSYQSSGYLKDPNSTYTSYSWDNVKFQRITIPVSIGRDIKMGKKKAIVFMGLRKSYLTKANRYYKVHTLKTFSNKIEEIDREYTEDMLDKKNYPSLKRGYLGMFIGLGVDITKRINLSMSVASDNYIDLSPGFSCFSSDYSNQDFALSIKYNLNRKL